MSTTFTSKSTVSGAAGALDPIPCFRMTSGPGSWFSQYFEIVVSGSQRGGPGGYCYKGCFAITLNNMAGQPGTIYPSSVNTLFNYNLGTGCPIITFTPSTPTSSNTITVNIQTSSINVPFPFGNGASLDQRFVATLIAYPTVGHFDELADYSIVAL
jgi:hypothetical protein